MDLYSTAEICLEIFRHAQMPRYDMGSYLKCERLIEFYIGGGPTLSERRIGPQWRGKRGLTCLNRLDLRTGSTSSVAKTHEEYAAETLPFATGRR